MQYTKNNQTQIMMYKLELYLKPEHWKTAFQEKSQQRNLGS